jgi:hypothetical protein
MKILTRLPGLMLAVMILAGAAAAAEQDYTWTISGELKGDADTNLVYVGVTSDSLLSAATVEVHYDTTLLEFVPYESSLDYLTGRTAVFTQAPIIGTGDGYVRIVLVDFDYSSIPAGSGDVLKFKFKVKPGVTGGTMAAFRLTRKKGNTTGVQLTTQQFEIEGSIWDNPGNPKDFTWKMKGLAVADSTTTEVNLLLTNAIWVADMALDLVYDPAVIEIAAPATDVTLLGRAADINLNVTGADGSGTARLTFSSTSSTPPFPVIDPGSGKIVGIKLSVVGDLPAGGSTEISVRHSDGTVLATHVLEARAYAGPTADVDGNGATSIFDVLEFLTLWQNAPSSPFTDVNGDGKSDIFDLLDILKAL